MKLKISDEELDALAKKYSNKHVATWTFAAKKAVSTGYVNGFLGAESHHQSKVDKLMQIVEMQREALEHYEDTSYIKVDGVDSQGYEIENEYFIAADAILKTDKMLKELNDKK